MKAAEKITRTTKSHPDKQALFVERGGGEGGSGRNDGSRCQAAWGRGARHAAFLSAMRYVLYIPGMRDVLRM